MPRVSSRGLKAGYLLVFVLLLAAALIGFATRGSAKQKAENECLALFEGVPTANKDGGLFKCTDCDPSCDADGTNTPNQACTFKLKVCVDEADSTGKCMATELKRPTVKGRCSVSALAPSPAGTALSCSERNLTVKLTK